MLRPLNLVLRRSLSSTSRLSYETIKVTRENKLGRLTFNRPDKYNAVNTEMYWEIIDGLKELKDDDDVTVVALTGEGKFYSSGNDLNAFSRAMASGKSPEEILQDSNDMMIQERLRNFVSELEVAGTKEDFLKNYFSRINFYLRKNRVLKVF